jgi:hypothetical protein
MGHADPDPVGVQHQHVLVVQPSPAGHDLLDPELEPAGGLGRCGRPALLHELPVDDLAQLAQALGVVGLHGRSSCCGGTGTKSTLVGTHGSPVHRAERAATGPPTVGTCTG